VLVPEAIEVYLRGEGGSFFPILRNVVNLDHCASQYGFPWCLLSWGRSVYGTCRS
jgi:hypothetical protein